MTKVKYGILLPNGELARLESVDTDDDWGYFLTDQSWFPEWLTHDPQVVARVLFDDTHSTNTSNDHPSWGKFKRDQLRIAKVVTTITEATDVELPINVTPIDTYDATIEMARMCKPNIPDGSIVRYSLCLAALSLKECLLLVDKTVCFGSLHNRRRIVAAVPTPEAYVSSAETYIAYCKRIGRPVPTGHCLLLCIPAIE